MHTDYTTHSSDLLAHEAHNLIGQAIGEYHEADRWLASRSLEYKNHRDTGNAIMHDIQCALFELKTRTPLAGEKQPPALWGGAVWFALAVGLVVGLVLARH